MKCRACWTVLMGAAVGTAMWAGAVRAEADAAVPAKDEAWYVAKYDKDGDGQVSDDEREAAKEHWQQAREKRKLKHHDKDGDGVLSESERVEADQAEQAWKQERLAKYDKDGDGRISQEERKLEHQNRKERRKAERAASATNGTEHVESSVDGEAEPAE